MPVQSVLILHLFSRAARTHSEGPGEWGDGSRAEKWAAAHNVENVSASSSLRTLAERAPSPMLCLPPVTRSPGGCVLPLSPPTMRFSTLLAAAAALVATASPLAAQTAKTGPGVAGPAPASATAVPPANDNFANATEITAPGTYLSSTVDATSETGEPTLPASCAASETGQSVWYRFTGTGSPVTFDTANSALAPGGTAIGFVDTILSIHSGTELSALTLVACNDDDPTNPAGTGDFTSRLANVPTTRGTIYYVRVTSFFGGAGAFDRSNGEVRLEASGTFVPPTGPSLVVAPTTVNFGTVATGQTRTETVTLTNNGTEAVTISSITLTGGAAFTATGTAAGTLAPGASRTVTITFAPTAGGAATATLTIASNAPGSPTTVAITGTGDASVTTAIPAGTTAGAPTYNRATNLGTGASGSCTVASGTAAGTNVNYVTQTFTVSQAGAYTITTDYSATTGYDGWIALYRGSFNPADPCLNQVAFDDDFATAGRPALQGSQIANSALTAGTYVLVITGYSSAGSDFGTYTGTVVGPAAVMFMSVAGEDGADERQASLSAWPNPAQGAAQVTLTVAEAQAVSVDVYDVTGRRVATLFNGPVSASQEVTLSLEAASLSAGMYVIRATGSTFTRTQRLSVVR